MLGIIGAMEVEVATLKSAINNLEVTKKAGMEFCMGNIFGKDVVVVKSGIGKVNAAICTQILVDDFQVDGVINTGVAGSLNNDINICDIVISTEALEHDMDVTPLGYEKSVIPDMETSVFKADKRLMEVAKKSAKEAELDVKIFEGKVVSGDQFIGTAEKKKYLRDQIWRRLCGNGRGINCPCSILKQHSIFGNKSYFRQSRWRCRNGLSNI